MKTRMGLVSNSSSSSFVCDICGEIESGMGAGLSDFEMFECKRGHTMHMNCIEDKEILAAIEKAEDNDEWETYEAPVECCPFCQMKYVTDGNIKTYLYKKLGLTDEMLSSEIKEKFKTYDEFTNYLKDNKDGNPVS